MKGIAGALLVDLIPFERYKQTWSMRLVIAAAFNAGFLALTVPLLLSRTDIAFTMLDGAMAFVVSTLVCLVSLPMMQWVAHRIATYSKSEEPVRMRTGS